MSTAKLEIACFNVQSALAAISAGVDRIEFCSGADVGGTTPAIQDLDAIAQTVRSGYRLPVHVMIRPRGGDFHYSSEEFEQMKVDIVRFRDHAGVNGLVYGVLDSVQGIDIHRNTELVKLAGNLPCTFHRAFDQCRDDQRALEDVILCGFKFLLTSGGHGTALDGIDNISRLVVQAESRITIIPGGGVRSINVERLQRQTNATWFHSSAVTDGGQIADTDEIRELKLNLQVADERNV